MVRILVVDDEEKILGIFVSFLSKMGFEVVQAAGGEKAIEFLKSGAPMDLMILDMKMPGATGLDVLKVKNILKDVRPVIIVTGSIGSEKIYDQLEEFGLGQGDVIYKPVDLFFLLEEIRKRLGMKT